MDNLPPDGDALDDAVANSRRAFLAALKNRDPEAAASVYAPMARLVAPSAQAMQGRRAIEAFWAAGLESGISDVELEPVDIDRRDGRAYEIGRYVLRLEPAEGGAVLDKGNYLLVHERQPDGSWLWAVEMFNPDQPPAHLDDHPDVSTPSPAIRTGDMFRPGGEE